MARPAGSGKNDRPPSSPGARADKALSSPASSSGGAAGADEGADQDLSLERLSQAFARAWNASQGSGGPPGNLGAPHANSAASSQATAGPASPSSAAVGGAGGATAAGEDPREGGAGGGEGALPPAGSDEDRGAAGAQTRALVPPLSDSAPDRFDRAADSQCPISPRTIAEAMLFVGHPENQPLTSRMMAALMRGVTPTEVDEVVEELNQTYLAEGAPYEIVVVEGGYRLHLRPEFDRLRYKFYGRVREARLSQSAIEVLALVAYNQPVERQRIDQLRGKPSAGLLNQLVRRDLLAVTKISGKSGAITYQTTDRFLDVFGLESLEDLPQPQSDDDPEL